MVYTLLPTLGGIPGGTYPTLPHPGYTLVYISYPLVYHVLHSVVQCSGDEALGSKTEVYPGYEAQGGLLALKV